MLKTKRLGGAIGLAAGLAMTAAFPRTGMALEPGAAQETPSGSFFGVSAKPLDPGIYGFGRALTFDAQQSGPGAPKVAGIPEHQEKEIGTFGLTFVPGWTFLGGAYSASLSQKFVAKANSAPANTSAAGMGDTFISPINLSWSLGGGLYVQGGVGVYVPDGTIQGPLGLSGVGTPYTTFQPQLIVSYLHDGWNLTAAIYDEINMKNPRSNYTSGEVLHGDFTATKTIGKWTFGPVAYFTDQITADTSSPAYMNVAQGKFSNFAVGGLVGYDFGPAKIKLWATDDVYAHGANTSNGEAGHTLRGFTAMGEVSFKIWDLGTPPPPDPTPAKRPLIYK